MRLLVNNFGAIKEAKIDLNKDFLIFAGENNSGKTYLTYLVHYIFKNDFKSQTFRYGRNIDFGESEHFSYILDINELAYLKGLIEDYFSNNLKFNLSYAFSVNGDFFKDTKLNIELNEDDIDLNNLKDAYLNIKDYFGIEILKETDSLEINFIKKREDVDLAGAKIEALRQIMLQILFKKHHTYIFPSVREGINIFSKELSVMKNKVFETLLDLGQTNTNSKELLDFSTRRFNKYPLPIRQSIESAQNLDVERTKNSDYAYLADELETLFLSGSVSVNTDGDVLFKPNNTDKTLDIHMTSSTVKSLSFLVLYLRHTAQKNDFIIIDEPELNLHPNNQRKIARFLVRLINEGFKILISTHSDYIIREINSLVMLASGIKMQEEATQNLLNQYGYTRKELLDKEKLGVYLFRTNSNVENVAITDTSFSIATIDDEVQKMNEFSQNIYFTLFD